MTDRKGKGQLQARLILLFIQVIFVWRLNAQSLESIVPVRLTQGHMPDSVSFVFTATDFNYFVDLPATFTSSLEIIDANAPWPPRWFMPASYNSSLRFTALMPLNASIQENKLSYYTVFRHYSAEEKQTARVAYIICNEDAEPIDTFYGDYEPDAHEFRLMSNGEKIYFDVSNQKVNLKDLFGIDTMKYTKYENIIISNSRDTVVFYWNAYQHLGIKSAYIPYCDTGNIFTSSKSFEWTQGSSVCFDYDGDILYSYKNIGIGKISRRDGHIVWRIDRNKLQPNALSDTIPIFLQHDFKSVKDAKGNIIYTVLSNGDNLNPQTRALEFTLQWTADSMPIFKLVKKIESPKNIQMTTAGNFDLEKDGNYLLSYGFYKGDTTSNHTFMEYRNSKDNVVAAYSISPHGFYYRVHKTGPWGPKRPEVIEKDGALKCVSGASGTWYKMEGKDLEALKPVVKSAALFRPKEKGYYCVAVPSGVGYAVSKPFNYSK